MPLTIYFPDAGTFTIEDDGIRGNNTSVIRNASGAVIFTIVHPADSLTFSMLAPGVNLIFNVADSFGTASVTVGSLTSAAQSPDSIVVRQIRSEGSMTLVSNGSIREGGSDVPADIIASILTLSAATGIGTAANALETQLTFIEAETTTGGINIANYGPVQIGGITADVDGLDVATSGNLTFSTTGFIVLSDTTGPEQVHGGDTSGNVTLTALGADADIFTVIDRPMIRAPGGGITLNAGRDIAAGTGGTNFNNDLLATGDIAINAGRDFLLDGQSNVRTGAFGGIVGGDIAITVGRNIYLTNTTGGLQTIEAFDGNVTLRTGPGGTYLQNASFPAAVQTTGDIILNADAVLLDSGGLNTTGVGSISIRPVTPGRAMDIGSTVDSTGALTLSEAELDRLFTLNISIGDASTGPIEFTAPISPTLFPINLFVRSATEILVRSSITLDASLTMRAGDDINFTAAGSFTTTNGGFFGFVDESQNDDGLGGLANLLGATTVTTVATLVGGIDNDTLNGNGAANILQGQGGTDTLRGFGGSDVLDGGAGNDTMIGGLGNDTFYVDAAGDLATEAAGEGTDRVAASASYALQAGSSIETLEAITLSGTTPLNLSGNALNQFIIGNNGNNMLTGGGGNDHMIGAGGNDTFFGNSSASAMEGGTGSDLFFVNDGSDAVLEASGEGTDRIATSVSYALLANSEIETLETMNLASTTAINLTGNQFQNLIIGNNGANVLDGKGGLDTLIGAGGADSFAFTTALAANNIDRIEGFVSGTDRIALEDAIFTAIAPGALAANAFYVGAQAVDADDRVIYNPATGALFYDPDGTGATAQVQFATLAGSPALAGGDFVLI